MTRLPSHLTGAPLAAFCLVGLERQYVPSAFGVEPAEADIVGDAFSRACITGGELLVVTDARSDLRFADSAMVTGAPFLRFYAGLPVRAPNGLTVGTLFVLDTRARELDPGDIGAFIDLRDGLEEMILLRTLAIRDPAPDCTTGATSTSCLSASGAAAPATPFR